MPAATALIASPTQAAGSQAAGENAEKRLTLRPWKGLSGPAIVLECPSPAGMMVRA